jgi:E3 ubiquitin-protein ligase SIAH1
MELDSIECVSYSDGMEDDDDTAAVTSSQLPRPFLKSSSTAGTAAAAAVNVVVVSDRAGAAGPVAGAGPLVISPATGVHELLECPVCTNSMYPPIHQVRRAPDSFRAFVSGSWLVSPARVA